MCKNVIYCFLFFSFLLFCHSSPSYILHVLKSTIFFNIYHDVEAHEPTVMKLIHRVNQGNRKTSVSYTKWREPSKRETVTYVRFIKRYIYEKRLLLISIKEHLFLDQAVSRKWCDFFRFKQSSIKFSESSILKNLNLDQIIRGCLMFHWSKITFWWKWHYLIFYKNKKCQ